MYWEICRYYCWGKSYLLEPRKTTKIPEKTTTNIIISLLPSPKMLLQGTIPASQLLLADTPPKLFFGHFKHWLLLWQNSSFVVIWSYTQIVIWINKIIIHNSTEFKLLINITLAILFMKRNIFSNICYILKDTFIV